MGYLNCRMLRRDPDMPLFSGILAFWRHGGLTNASQEGFNNKIRWLIGQAYGFRDYEYFRLKIFDLPSTSIRKAL